MIGGFISDIHGTTDVGQRFPRRPFREEKRLALGELWRLGIMIVTLIEIVDKAAETAQ